MDYIKKIARRVLTVLMNSIDRIERGVLIVLMVCGAILFLSAFVGDSMLNMVGRITIGGFTSLAAFIEMFPGKIKKAAYVVYNAIRILALRITTRTLKEKIKRRNGYETDFTEAQGIQRSQVEVRK